MLQPLEVLLEGSCWLVGGSAKEGGREGKRAGRKGRNGKASASEGDETAAEAPACTGFVLLLPTGCGCTPTEMLLLCGKTPLLT